jgi:ubiquinol-cytochrome c reductase iron-sulfur subunit
MNMSGLHYLIIALLFRSNTILNLIKTSELFSFSKLPSSLSRSFAKIPTGPASHEHQYDEDTNGPHEHINKHKGRVSETSKLIQSGSGIRGIGRNEGNLFQLPTIPTTFKRSFHQLKREKSTFSSEISSSGIPKPPTVDPAILKDPSTTPEDSQTFTYLMVGGAGVAGAMAAKSTVMNFLSSLSASGDVLAMAQVEMDLSSIPEGKSVVIKWRGKPIFIRHRTPAEIEAARNTDISHLRDPQSDSDRVQKPEWLVMLGICTHLGCVPNSDSGDYGGWYCPCQ